VRALVARVAKLEADLAMKSAGLLTVRENVARNTLETSGLIRASNAAPAAAATMSLSTATPNTFGFAVGRKQLKRKASVELVPAPKRPAGKPDKASFQHWVLVGPVLTDAKTGEPGLFRKLLETALGAQVAQTVPSAYVERLRSDPKMFNVGFSTNNANLFVGQWAGARSGMEEGLQTISVHHAVVAGSSGAKDNSTYWLGNQVGLGVDCAWTQYVLEMMYQ
jgi:hypothetical protein